MNIFEFDCINKGNIDLVKILLFKLTDYQEVSLSDSGQCRNADKNPDTIYEMHIFNRNKKV